MTILLNFTEYTNSITSDTSPTTVRNDLLGTVRNLTPISRSCTHRFRLSSRIGLPTKTHHRIPDLRLSTKGIPFQNQRSKSKFDDGIPALEAVSITRRFGDESRASSQQLTEHRSEFDFLTSVELQTHLRYLN